MRRPRPTIGDQGAGTWKLVYADLVTVLMICFAVLWVMSMDKKGMNVEDGQAPLDITSMGCLQETVDVLRARMTQDFGPASAHWPIQIDLSPSSLRLTLVDYQLPMFEVGRSTLSDFARSHLRTLGKMINRCPNLPLKIEGYTDALPYAGGDAQGYGNWELSTDRANAARRELVANGVGGQRFWQVVGYGSSKPVFPERPNAPQNRRVSITLWLP